MINQILENIKNTLSQNPENPAIELFFKDISHYKYISQNPVVVMNFRGLELEKSPHPTLLDQKGSMDLSFFYFLRSIDDANSDRVLAFFESVRALDGLEVQAFRPYLHKKTTAIWEIKARVERVF